MRDSYNIEQLIRPVLKKLKPYKAVEPTDILSKRSYIPLEKIIKLDANENPYGCSPKVQSALADYKHFNLYPDPQQRELRKALTKYTKIQMENIIVGSGSDELIELILRLFLEPGDKVINCPPTFGMYSFCTQICAGNLTIVPRNSDFSININKIKKNINKRTKVIFLASPNNPTGNIISKDDIFKLLDTELIVVIDEAYAEFSGESFINLVPKFPNLLVLRTFSKWAGLAGLRVGYGIFPANIVSYLMKIKQPYNVNIAAQIAALRSLEDISYLKKTIKAIISERNRLYKSLNEIKWLKAYESSSNFILCLVLKKDAKEIYQKLQREGIFIRYYDSPDLQNYIRISIGKPEHNNKLLAALHKLY